MFPGASLTSFAWTFGDGRTAATYLPSINHSYSATGTYTVVETVTDNIGCMDTATVPIHFTITHPTPDFTATSSGVCAGATVRFTNTSIGAVSYFWNFGDGGTSSAPSPSHVYSVGGTYSVKLIATDGIGCPDSLTKVNYIHLNPQPDASFKMSDSFAVCPPLNVRFTNTTVGAASCSWTFGDGNASSAVSPSNTYAATGPYTIRLIALNSSGCQDTVFGHASIFGYPWGIFLYACIRLLAAFR